MENLELNIPSMQSAHCQSRVKDVIKDIVGLKIEKLEAGKLSLAVANEAAKDLAIASIGQAGYQVATNEAQ